MHFLKVAFRRPRPYWSTFFGWNLNKCRVISKVEGDIRSGGWYQKIERSMNTILPWYRWYHPSSRGYHPSTKNLRFFWTKNTWTWAWKERQMRKMANPVRFLVRVITKNYLEDKRSQSAVGARPLWGSGQWKISQNIFKNAKLPNFGWYQICLGVIFIEHSMKKISP